MTWLIFPHQLFSKRYDEKIILIEHPRFFSDFDFHKQKLLLHRASMKEFEGEIETTDYIEFDDQLEKPFKKNKTLRLYRPEDHKLKKWIENTAEKHDTELKIQESPMFLTSMDWNRQYFQENSYSQLPYYKAQRKRLDVMVDEDGNPEGGKWSFDPENREKMPKDHEPPSIPEFHSKTLEEAKQYVKTNFPDNPGSLTVFIYPTTREQALENLSDFLDNRLENFGRYQDAIDRDLTYGYHSVLSPSLNIGLITPEEVIDKTIKTREQEDLPLNSVEGFIRQIMGWREFVRAIYHLEPKLKDHNFWKNENEFPKEFYTAQTSIPPIDQSIKRVKNNAYTHHIERLMVLGNPMLLLELDPDQVYRWFMEMFIDSYDWVMTPNIYGMSQYSYTKMMTKPYISSSNYIKKMSNYDKGEWEEIWDGLYWSFVKKYREKIEDIPRMKMMTSHLDRMNESTLKQHQKNAEEFKERLSIESDHLK